jgi:hypothetical protein
MNLRWCLAIVLCFAPIGYVGAEEPAGNAHQGWLFWCNRASTCPSVGACPNDYVCKPMPSICSVSRCGGIDDYCRKPPPCVPALPRCGSPDDYCRKALPVLLCPPLSPYLRCGPCDGVGDKRR